MATRRKRDEDTPKRRAERFERRVADVLAEGGARGLGLAVAVSGGRDSTVLAHLVWRLAARLGARAALIHVHHGLRGAEADADQAFVADLARRWGCAFATEAIDPRAARAGQAGRGRETLQEAARRLRYAAFTRLAARVQADIVLTAHHADDQAETVLLRLFRGTGPDGLGGIPERTVDGRVWRPLLAESGAEIAAYAGFHGLAWREDASNTSDAYARNRLRRHWIPGLQADFNPQLLQTVAQLAEAQRRDSEWIQAAVAQEVRARLVVEGAWLRIDVKDWGSLPAALARRVAREALIRAGAGRSIERVHLERMLAFLAEPRGGRRIELPGGLSLQGRAGECTLGPLPGSGESVC
ncbi:MAG: tRNA lysidine(34) synthetase TilS [Myxococcota bacterium]